MRGTLSVRVHVRVHVRASDCQNFERGGKNMAFHFQLSIRIVTDEDGTEDTIMALPFPSSHETIREKVETTT